MILILWTTTFFLCVFVHQQSFVLVQTQVRRGMRHDVALVNDWVVEDGTQIRVREFLLVVFKSKALLERLHKF